MDSKLQNSRNEGQTALSRRRIFAFDILRIICALLIFGRHSITMYGCSYGLFADKVICALTQPIMTCFFALSGFCLQYAYRNADFRDGTAILRFWEKRLLTLLPAYYFINLLWLVCHPDSLTDWLILQPTEILGIQSSFQTLFGVLHNGGSWFVSCMLFCYLLFPIAQILLKPLSLRKLGLLYVILYALNPYAYLVTRHFSLETIYANPAFRLLEFLCGAITASVVAQPRSRKALAGLNAALIAAGGAALIFLRHDANFVTWFSCFLAIPAVSLTLTACYLWRCEPLENSGALKYFGLITYHFYISQWVLWPIVTMVMNALHLEGNGAKKACSFLICLALGVLSHELIDRPVRKLTLRAIAKP